MRDIARMIWNENPSIVWISFSAQAIEFGIGGDPRDWQSDKVINSAFQILQNYGYQPKQDGITYRS